MTENPPPGDGPDGAAAEDEAAAEHVARLFDIRRIIGGLFCLYGVVIAIAGLFDSAAEIDKAQGVNINLWTGIIMFLVGVVFFVWQWLRPLRAAPRAPGYRPE